MSKIFLSVGSTTTESIDEHQPVWLLLPETRIPAVASTYARQIHPGAQVLLWLGSVKNIFEHHFLPQLRVLHASSLAKRKPEYGALRAEIEVFAGDLYKRAQIFLSFLSARRRIELCLYPIIDKITQRSGLTRKDASLLVDAVCAAVKGIESTLTIKKSNLHAFIETGECDKATILWLALCVDPKFSLHLGRDNILAEEPAGSSTMLNVAALQNEMRRAVEKIRNGGSCPESIASIDLKEWLTSLTGCAPEQRFFAEARKFHEGLNRYGCLKFEVSNRFSDFGENAPRFISLETMSRAMTAFERALSHLVIRYASDDAEMKELTGKHVLHSGLLVRGLVGDLEAMRVLYPVNETAIPGQPELTARLIEKTCRAINDGALAHVCGRHYGIAPALLQRGVERLLAILRKTLPIMPIEVNHLVHAIESQIKLRKVAERQDLCANRRAGRQQAAQLNIAARAARARQFAIARMLQTDFHVDPSRLFYIDDLLIDRINAIYGPDLEFMRKILVGYIERCHPGHHEVYNGIPNENR